MASAIAMFAYAKIKSLILVDPADPLVSHERLLNLSSAQGLNWTICQLPSGVHICVRSAVTPGL